MCRLRVYLCCIVCGLLLACVPSPVPKPDASLIAHAPTTDGPVIWAQGEHLITAWVGANDEGVFQVAQPEDSEPVVLPLPPRHPFAQQGYPATQNRLHLLWLDSGSKDVNQLFAAVLTSDLTVERGPTAVSDRFTQRYAAASASDGGVWVVWSGGLAAEPALYAQQIDFDGRPLQAQRIALNADWPALVGGGTSPSVYWLDRESGDLWRAAWDGSAATRLTGGVRLATGDRISGVSAAAQADQHSFIWNITRADGSDESWASAGSAQVGGWPAPQRLTVLIDAVPQPVRWLAFALAGSGFVAAAQVGDAVGLLALAGAEAQTFTSAASLSADLIGPLRLLALANARYALSWAEPEPDAAALRVVVVEMP